MVYHVTILAGKMIENKASHDTQRVFHDLSQATKIKIKKKLKEKEKKTPTPAPSPRFTDTPARVNRPIRLTCLHPCCHPIQIM